MTRRTFLTLMGAGLQANAAQDIYAASAAQNNREYFPLTSGQSVGLINNLPGAAEVIRNIINEANVALSNLNKNIRVQ